MLYRKSNAKLDIGYIPLKLNPIYINIIPEQPLLQYKNKRFKYNNVHIVIHMVIVKDAMVLIHLAKLSILEKSCDYFKKVLIPRLVHQEIIEGEEKGFPDVQVILNIIKNKKIIIKQVNDGSLIKKANQFNVQRGEAEVIALYWQERANLIATDDDNVRKKKTLLNIEVVGTPVIILKLFMKRIIDENKAEQCVSELRKIGWFSNVVLDKILMEVKNG